MNSQQRELTAEYILPYLEGIMVELAWLRRALDQTVAAEARGRSLVLSELLKREATLACDRWIGEELTQIMRLRWTDFESRLSVYPIGACKEISFVVFEMIRRNPQMFQRSALNRLQEFREAGGVFKRIWGSIRGVYFQNAMQVGSHYIDVANDTVDSTKPSTDQAPLEKSGFKNFETFGEYAAVRSSYTGDRVLRNNFIPALLPYRPLWMVNDVMRTIRIDAQSEPILRMIELGEGRSFADLSGPEVGCLASETLIEKLGAPFGSSAASGKLEFRLVVEGEFQKAVERFERITMAERCRELERVTQIVRLVNFVWRNAGMYDRVAAELTA